LFDVLRLNLPIWNLCSPFLFTAILTVNLATTRQWSVSQSAALNDRTSSRIELLHLSIWIWSIWMWIFPSRDVQVYLWMLRCGSVILWIMRFSDVVKFTTLTPLSLLISCKLSFPIIGLDMSSQLTLAIKSPNKIFVWYLRNLLNIISSSL
jgi:hypothetical protein